MSELSTVNVAFISVVIFVLLLRYTGSLTYAIMNYIHTYIHTSRLVHLNTQVQPVQYFLNERNRIAALFLAQGIVNRTAAVTPVGGLMNIKDPSFRLPRLDTSNTYFMNIERFSQQKLE